MKLLMHLEKNKYTWFILFLLFSFSLLRLPSLIEPYWYGDEGIYHVVADSLLAGKKLYSEIWDNKPPLIYLVYALFSSNQFLIRSLSLFFGIISIISFYLLANQLLNKKIASFITGIFAILFAVPTLEGNIANAENFMLFFIINSILLFITGLKKALIKKDNQNIINNNDFLFSNKIMLISGILLGVALLFKFVAFFDFLSLLIFYIFFNYPSQKHDIKKFQVISSSLYKIRFFLIGFILPFLSSLIFFITKKSFSDYLDAIFLSNISYIGYKNQIFFPHDILLGKIFLLFIFIFILFKLRRTISINNLFIVTWLIFSLFNIYFSQRPYTHYLLLLLPSFCLFLGLFLLINNKSKIFVGSSILVILLLINSTFKIYSTNYVMAYYKNFIDFLTLQKTTDEYRAFFDKNTPRDYALASYLKNRIKNAESLYIWGNNPQIYSLSNKIPPVRFTTAYHIIGKNNAISETQRVLEERKPQYIIILPTDGQFPFVLPDYDYRITIQNAHIYERIL